MASFIEYYKEAIHKNAEEKGFWEAPINIPEKLMLVVSELSEALEALREENYCDPLFVKETYEKTVPTSFMAPQYEMSHFEKYIKNKFEDEIADAFIRLLDICHHMNIDIEKQIAIKHRYNTLREYKHGKKF